MRFAPAVLTGFARTGALLGAMILGALLPSAHALSWAIRWLVVAMLYNVFLQTRFSRQALQPSHAAILAANLAVGVAAWSAAGLLFPRDVALAAFFAGIAPTATAAPVIMAFLRGRVEYVIASFLLTNVAVAALLPALIPWVLGQPTPEAFGQVSRTVGLVVFAPMLAAWATRLAYPPAAQWPSKLGSLPFGMWALALFLITANTSHFLRSQVDAPLRIVLEIAGVSLAICAINFLLGRWVGGRAYPREASQSLGQKNTTFTIYLAVTYANPIAALGPTCYVLWHNLWNTWQLHRQSQRERKQPAART